MEDAKNIKLNDNFEVYLATYDTAKVLNSIIIPKIRNDQAYFTDLTLRKGVNEYFLIFFKYKNKVTIRHASLIPYDSVFSVHAVYIAPDSTCCTDSTKWSSYKYSEKYPYNTPIFPIQCSNNDLNRTIKISYGGTTQPIKHGFGYDFAHLAYNSHINIKKHFRKNRKALRSILRESKMILERN